MASAYHSSTCSGHYTALLRMEDIGRWRPQKATVPNGVHSWILDNAILFFLKRCRGTFPAPDQDSLSGPDDAVLSNLLQMLLG